MDPFNILYIKSYQIYLTIKRSNGTSCFLNLQISSFGHLSMLNIIKNKYSKFYNCLVTKVSLVLKAELLKWF